MSLQIALWQIQFERQDSHIVIWKTLQDKKKWEDILEYDLAEARRLGKR